MKTGLLGLLLLILCNGCWGGANTLFSRAKTSVTLPCTTLSSLRSDAVTELSWVCRGCLESVVVSAEAAVETQLLRLRDGQTTVLQKRGRLSLLEDSVYSLRYEPVEVEDSGEYVCRVDGHSSGAAAIRLLVQDFPSAPGRPLITNFTSRSVFLSWTPGSRANNSPIIHYVIRRRADERGGWSSDTITTPDNKTAYVVENLQPFTAYSFRLTAVNGIGSSPDGIASYPIITLREPPGGRPVIVAAHNTSATSVRVRWKPLSRKELHGEFQSYHISYRARGDPGGRVRQLRISDERVLSHTIRGLRPFTQYLVSIQVGNPAGIGPSSTVAVSTDESVPEAPSDVTVLNVTDTSILVRWQPPALPNGQIVGYRIYYTIGSFTSASWLKLPVQNLQYTLQNLAPLSNYSITVKAFTRSAEGRESAPLTVATDASPPSAPLLLSVRCQSGGDLLLTWRRPEHCVGGIDYYLVRYRPVVQRSTAFQRLQVAADVIKQEYKFLLPNLTKGTRYEVQLRAATRSRRRPSVLLLSPYSQPLSAEARQRCGPPGGAGSGVQLHTDHGGPTDGRVVAGVVCTSAAFLLVVLALTIWRWWRPSQPCADSPLKARAPVTCDPGWEREGPAGTAGPVPAEVFPLHVAGLSADGNRGFRKEYDEILEHSMRLGLSCKVSQAVGNKRNNRYHNIGAHDHTLVPLRPLPGQTCGDYINANYIDGFLVRGQYIGAQAPLPGTFSAFWRLIWEQRVHVIAMITNLVERSRRKCDMYWPGERSQTYGPIHVELLRTKQTAMYIIRTLLIRHTKYKKKAGCSERVVFQYHYTGWPDHGVPDHPLPIISFVRKSAAANGAGAGPILVHCSDSSTVHSSRLQRSQRGPVLGSAGVGRTGVYILLDAMLAMLRQRAAVNVFGYLRHVRTQRRHLVQTEEQYVFVHHALLEAVLAGETEVRGERLPEYLRRLRSPGRTGSQRTQMHRQYQLVTSFQPSEAEQIAASTPCNRVRNRSAQFVPLDQCRVLLSTRAGVEGSDYINATFFPGYEKQDEFIVTQHPLQHTSEDFWRMVWEYNAQTIVVLSSIDNQNYPRFWPSPEESQSGAGFKVRWLDEPASCFCGVVLLMLQSLQDDYQQTVRLLLSPGWPHTVAESPHRLVDVVQQATREFQEGPLVVVDRFGGTEAATFCCVTSLAKQLSAESSIDVYFYAKLYHFRRPGVWPSQADFEFLYGLTERLVRPGTACSPRVADDTGSSQPPSLRSAHVSEPPHSRECLTP